MNKVYERLRGERRIEVFGAMPEGLLNAAALAAIELWDMECVDANTLRLSLYETELERLRRIAGSGAYELREISGVGGSRDRRLLKRRLPLIIAALATAALFFLSSLFIWEIDIRGAGELSWPRILRALSQCGVENGRYWPALSSDLVRSQMLRLMPEIGWMTVNVNGSRATVLICPRQEKPEIYDESAAAHIVAARTGIIKRLSVKNGKAVVSPGQAVTEGELLVSGVMDSLSGGSRYVRASAGVMADTWYELCSVRPLREEQKEAMALRRSRFALVFEKRRINLYIDSGKAIDECDKIIHEYKLGIDGLFAMPLKLVREEYRSYRLTEAEASGTLMRETLDGRLKDLVKGEVIQRSFTESVSEELIVLTLRAHCLEDIGRTVPID